MARSAVAPELSRLGAGGREDRLSFRLVARILWRCVPLLHPVRWHLGAFAAGAMVSFLVGAGLSALGFDVLWTRVLSGDPPTDLELRILGLDAASFGEAPISAELRRTLLVRLLAIAAPLTALCAVLACVLYYYSVWIRQRINQALRVLLFERLQALSLRFHHDQRVGDAVYRLFQDSAMVTQLIDALFLTPAFQLARFALMTLLLLLLDPRLAVLLVVTWPPLLVLSWTVSRTLRGRFRAARESNSDLTSRVQEIAAGIRVIKAYGFEARAQEHFERDSRRAFDAALRARSLFAVFSVVVFWIVSILLVAAVTQAAWLTRGAAPLFAAGALALLGFGVWTLGLFNVVKGLFGMGTVSQRALFREWARIQDIAIGLDRVFELLDLEPEVRDAPHARVLGPVRWGVRFRDVGFSYQAGRPVLEGIDLEARVGTTTAIVGPTGAGKSTLMALLLRLFDPSRGVIEIDGSDLRGLRLDSLRRRVAIALQENLLFGSTVRENVRYAVPDADDSRVREAARLACADGFVAGLGQGYDTPLGERGTKLSTGQRQRLSIARALLKDAPILILDEPTASLDAETERQLLDNLARWGRERVIFLITHRLSTIRRADQIVYLADGRVREMGTHDQLMARPDGAYRRLVLGEAPEIEPDDRLEVGGRLA